VRALRTHLNCAVGALLVLRSLRPNTLPLVRAETVRRRQVSDVARPQQPAALHGGGSEARCAAKERIARHDAVRHTNSGVIIASRCAQRASRGAAGGRNAP
jgi:hypothetical protein